MIRTVRFDGNNTALSAGFQQTQWFSRSDAATDDAGQPVAANVPRYGNQTLILPAPAMSELRSPRPDQTWIWSGRWTAGEPCLVENWQASGIWTIEISAWLSGVKQTWTTPMGSGRRFDAALDPGWQHVPTACIVVDGLVLVFCAVSTGASPSVVHTVSCVYWDRQAAPNPKWVLKSKGPSIQFQGNSCPPEGQPRGAPWMASGPWVPPGGIDAQGNILDCFVAWVDYRNNGLPTGGATGGQLFLMRCTRANKDAPWQLGNAVLLLEEKFEDASGNRVPGYPMGDRESFMHFHGASVAFGTPVNGETPMTVTLTVGDSAANNRMVNITRDDYTTYDQGWSASLTTGTAALPYAGVSTGPWPATPKVQNGWTVRDDREGQRMRFDFQNAVYDKTAKTLELASFADFNPAVGSITPVQIYVLSPGFTSVEMVAVTGKATATKLQLSRELFVGSTGSQINGFIFPDASVQGVLIQPHTDPAKFILGGDEQGTMINSYRVDDAGKRIEITTLHGVPTHAAQDYEPGASRCLGWLCFLGTHRRQASGVIDGYAALVTPGSVETWKENRRAAVVMYSPEGVNWGEMYAPESTQAIPFGFIEAVGADPARFILGRREPLSLGLYAIPRPAPGSTRLRRPILVSPGGTNSLRRFSDPVTGFNGIEVTKIAKDPYDPAPGSGFFNEAKAVDPSSLAGLGVPLPPTAGPIMRLKFIDQATMGLWTLTDPRYFGGTWRARIRFWMYRMPTPVDATDPNQLPVASPAGLSFKLVFSASAPTSTDAFGGLLTPTLKTGTVGGTGKWIPMTFDWESQPLEAGNYALYAIWNYQQKFARQDVLIAWDSVQAIQGGQFADLPGRPLRQKALNANPLSSSLERLTLSEYPPPPIGEFPPEPSEWSMFLAARLPEGGPDPFVQWRAANTNAVTLWTIADGYGRFLRVVLDRTGPNSDHVIRLIDHVGASWEVAGPTAGSTPTPGVAQPFYFIRGRQLLLGIASVVENGAQRYRVWVACGGSRTQVLESAAVDPPLSMVLPQTLRSGDAGGNNPDPAEFFGVWVDDTTAISIVDGVTKLQTLDFLVE